MKPKISACVFILLGALAASGEQVSVELSVVGGAVDDPKVRGRLVARPVDVSASGIEPVVADFSAPASVPVDLEAGHTWELRLEADGWWAPPTYVVPNSAPDSRRPLGIRLMPTGRVGGLLTPPQDAPGPRQVSVRFEAAGDGGANAVIPRTTERCPVDALGRFDCPVPAGRLDLRVRVAGYISHYFWEREIEAGGLRWLRGLRLVRGASMVGWVVDENGDPLPVDAGVTVTATPRDHPSFPPAPDGDALDLEAEPNEKGFFHLTGLRPGAYVLRARADGYAVTESPMVGALGDKEAELVAPLVLRRPLDLAVQVTPPVDDRGESWELMLVDAGRTTPVASGDADEAGRWTATDVAAGSYSLVVSDSGGRRLLNRKLDLDETTGLVFLTLVRVEVEGEVRLGDEPLAARVAFGGFTGAVSVRMEADEEGRFSGWLPRAGEWRVDVRSGRPPVYRRFAAVEVEENEGGSPTEVLLELPDSLLEGEVVDGEGKPVRSAVVVVTQVLLSEMPSFHRVDKNGRFQFRGLAAGDYRLQAVGAKTDGGQVHSLPVDVHMPEAAPYAEVRLVLEPPAVLEGRVVSEWGGVPRAKILARPVHTSSSLLNPTTTGPDGGLRINLPNGVETVDLTIQAPGFVLAFRDGVQVGGAEPVVVPLHQGPGGHLRLRDLGVTPGHDVVYRARVEYEGRAVSWSVLRNWADLHQQPTNAEMFIVPQLPAGRWLVCQVTPTPAAEQDCRDGFLTPGSFLDFEFKPVEPVE